MVDNRTDTRKNTDAQMVVVDLNSGDHIGNLLNISNGGFMLLSPSPIELDKLYRLEIRLSHEINGKSTIQLGADSLWSNALNDDKHFWTGFQIIDISGEDQHIVQQLLTEI